jgi:hypothetical protein
MHASRTGVVREVSPRGDYPPTNLDRFCNTLLRPDGTAGASGMPDPKDLLDGDVLYFV